MTKKPVINKKDKPLSVREAKKSSLWKVIPLSKLPDTWPVIGISQYQSKSMAKFFLVKEVIVPIPKPTRKKKSSH